MASKAKGSSGKAAMIADAGTKWDTSTRAGQLQLILACPKPVLGNDVPGGSDGSRAVRVHYTTMR